MVFKVTDELCDTLLQWSLQKIRIENISINYEVLCFSNMIVQTEMYVVWYEGNVLMLLLFIVSL